MVAGMRPKSQAHLARPRPDLPSPAVLLARVDAEGRIAVRVTPGAKSEGLDLTDDGKVLVRVRAKPEDGKANDAVRTLLASGLGIAPSRVELLRGATSREKQFRITGPLPRG